MKLFRMIGRNIRDAFRSVIRNFSLSLASISCISITLLVVSISVVASYNVENFTKLMKKDVTMIVFLEKNIEQSEIDAIEEKIRLMINVDSYDFRSKEEARKLMQESSEVFDRIMANWTPEENPLQNTFLIKVLNIEEIKETANEISELDKVYIVKYGEGMVEQLLSIFKIIEKGTISLVLALILVTAFLVSNTIKITIFSRKSEIFIMRLVGASNITIKLPYIIEGLFLGILGAVIPIIVTIYGYNIFYTEFDGKLFSPFLRFITPEPFIYMNSLGLAILGMLLGMWGSARAVKKHLKI